MGAMSRALGRPACRFDRVEDYEAVTSPVYAWRDAVARDGQTGNALNGVATLAAWRALGGGDTSGNPALDGAPQGGPGAGWGRRDAGAGRAAAPP